MNGVQATMLVAAAPVETGLVVPNQSSKSARDSSPARVSFEKHFKKACQAQNDNSESSSEVRDDSDPLKTETDNKNQEKRVDQVKDQPSEVKLDEKQNTEKASDSTTETNARLGSSTSMVLAQVMFIPFIGLVKIDGNPLQQGIQAGEVGAEANVPINPEVQLSSNTNLESSQLVSQALETTFTERTSPAAQQSDQSHAVQFAVNDETTQALAVKMDIAGETLTFNTQIKPAVKLGTGQEIELDGQVVDEKVIKKTEGDVRTASGKNLAEFESQRVSVIGPTKENSSAEGQQQSLTGSEEESSSPVLQQVEVEIPKTQVRNVPTSVQNSRAVFDAQDLMDQVVKKAEVMLKENSSEMTLQLKPGFLGKMTIKIAVDEAGTVTAHFSTSSQQVKNALEQNIQTLRQTLEAQGIKVDRTEVNVQLDSGGMMSDPGGRQDLWQQPRGIPFIGFSDSESEIIQTASQPGGAVQTDGYETTEASDGYNFLV